MNILYFKTYLSFTGLNFEFFFIGNTNKNQYFQKALAVSVVLAVLGGHLYMIEYKKKI